MGRLIVVENVSLDGVMQAPGRPDEDERGGFDLPTESCRIRTRYCWRETSAQPSRA